MIRTHMLVMELMHGRKLIDGIRDQYKKIAKQMGKTLHELEDEQRQKISLGQRHVVSVSGFSEPG